MRIASPILALVVGIAFTATPAIAQGDGSGGATEPAEHAIVTGEEVVFEPIEVPGFDSGMKIAVLHGDPMGDAGDYTIRLTFPDGYRFPSHWHPKAEHLTVLEGTFLLAMGEEEDESALVQYAPGDFLYIPAEDPHFGGATGKTAIQLHGQAPFEIYLTNPTE